MGRIIKFRALNANNELICGLPYTDGVNETNYFKDFSNRLCWRNNDGAQLNQPYKNGTLMQFTGRSKGEIEVYEHDIFSETDGDRKIYFVVTWINEYAAFAMLEVSEYLDYLQRGAKVIEESFEGFYVQLHQDSIDKMTLEGNIHQNKELLCL